MYSRFELPALAAEPLPWNLVEVAEDLNPGGDKWSGGVSWVELATTKPRTWDPWVGGNKNLSIDNSTGEFSPVVLYLPYVCPTSGPATDDDRTAARKAMEAATPAGVEAIFWAWAFNAADAVGVTGDAVPVIAALGQKLADKGLTGAGTIHMPPWSAEHYLSRSGFDAGGDSAPRTNRGDKISVGAGYPSVGTANSTQAVVASGPVGVAMSDIDLIESDGEDIITTNRRVILAERYVTIQTNVDLLTYGVIDPS